MWSELPAETLAWRTRCQRFAAECIAPHVTEYDAGNAFPAKVHDHARAWELIHRDFPTEYGGVGMSDVDAVAGAEALATVCAPTAFTIGFSRGSLHPVLAGGTHEQKQRFIAQTLTEGKYSSLCLTEPDVSGSNLIGVQTTATRTDRGWVIQGTKCMVGNGGVASLFLVLARTIEHGQPRGLTFFAVPRSEAVEVGPNPDKLGFRCVETPDVVFHNVEIDDDCRIGAVGSGDQLMVDTVHTIRVGGGAIIAGIAAGALRDALPWVQERQVYGGSLMGKSHVQLILGGLYARLQSVRSTVIHAATLRQAGKPYGQVSSMGKLHAAELAVDATSQVSQLFGWRGIRGDFPIQKRLRDARQAPIFEGTSEIQKLNLFRELMTRYRDTGEI